jgi:predicted nucleotidyltransferase
MKNILLIISFVFIIQGCKSKNEKNKTELNQTVNEITFGVKVDGKEGFENDIMPWISIKNPESEIENLIGKDEIVIERKFALLRIDYPLSNPVEIMIMSDSEKGFTRKKLVEEISKAYNQIYKEEEETSNIKTIPIFEREGVINRNQTDGKYGIWGHDIDDLDLSGIVLREIDSGYLKLELNIES